MKVRIMVCIFVLMVLIFSVVGSTAAWFTMESRTMENVFTAGTVKISKPKVVTGCNEWKPGKCNTIKLKVQNTGSKRSYIRVKPKVDIEYKKTYEDFTAWIKGIRINCGSWFGQYIEYKKGSYKAQNPRKADLVAGAKEKVVGHAYIWDDGSKLYIKLDMKDDNFINEYHIYAGKTDPTHSIPGQYPFKDEFSSPADEVNFSTSYVYDRLAKPWQMIDFKGLGNNEKVYIGVHIAGDTVSNSEDNYVEWGLAQVSEPYWVKGDDGWWYYGTDQGPIIVQPGEYIYISFTFCLSKKFKGTIDFSLEAEAVQTTHGAIDYIWPDNPWRDD